MYLEKRIQKNKAKYYLVYSYREKGKVRKIRKYLGQNLTRTELEQEKRKAEQNIKKLLEKINTEVFLFSLTKNQVRKLNKYNDLIKVTHLSDDEWRKFTEEFTYNTNAIEGSTIERDEVPNILEKHKISDSEEIETKGVANAVRFLKNTKEDMSVGLIKKLHKLCFEGSKEFAGKIRNVEVVVANSSGEIIHRGVHSSKLQSALNDLIFWYRKNKNKFKPIVLAGIIHNQFECIHPFQDGNGRVGRLLLNFILIKSKYPPINISLEDRAEYYNSLQEYQKKQKGKPDSFPISTCFHSVDKPQAHEGNNVDNLKPTIIFLVKQYKKTLKKVTTKIKTNKM